jgi:threonine synthase
MFYTSTRNLVNGENQTTSAQAIKQGLADDGGLFMPCDIPKLADGDLTRIREMGYDERAAYILSLYLTDYTFDELYADAKAAYGESNFKGGAAAVKNIGGGMSALELWHGPTAAFKDLALQIMPKMLSRALVKTGESRTAYILVATSGDTGKAALEGYRDVNQVRITVFYPADGVSRVQKLQMTTQEGGNVNVCAVKGNFDDTQNGVKKIFSDAEAAKKLDDKNHFFSSANSINWGRLAPQIVYYISAYCDMLNAGTIKDGEKINVCVPTGNFGDIFAGYLAKHMGLPIDRLICASNKNKVLTDFFADGIYDKKRTFYTTMSPSMDILISSNLERLLYVAAGSELTAKYMAELAAKGEYRLDADVLLSLSRDFIGMYCGEDETAATIKSTYEKYGYLCDTHTAVAVKCAEEYKAKYDAKPMLVISTASPYKFAADVYRSLTGKQTADELSAADALSGYTGIEIPGPLQNIEKRKVRFDKVINPSEMENEVLTSL